MLGRRLILLSCLLAGGVAIVWLFGVDEGESLLRAGRSPGSADSKEPVVEAAEHSPSTARAETDDPQTPGAKSLAVGNARIPIREGLTDRPDIRVLKYLILIGSSDGAIGRRVRASDVRIEVYNKKPDPESKKVAVITGGNAEIEFSEPPDPNTGFRDARLLSMSLRSGNRIEYLDESEAPIAVLQNDDLHLTDDEITGEGPCTIDLKGLLVSGTGLRYDRVGGGLELHRDIVIRGRSFELPSRKVQEAAAPASSDEPSEDEPEKTIACTGPFTFQPKKAEDRGAGAADAEISSLLSEGTMSFHGSVVATQGDRSRLECEDLEIVLDESAPAAPAAVPGAAAENKLNVSRMFARGSSTKPCVLDDSMGKFVAETLLQEEKPDGTWVTLNGHPRVEDASLAASDGATEPQEAGPSFDASASRQIRLRPGAPPEATPGAAPGAPIGRRFLVEIDGDAKLSAAGLSGDETVDLSAEMIEMHLASAPPAAEGDANAKAESGAGLERLLARGDATGTLSKGVFRGDRIELVPVSTGSAEANESPFRLSIEPNPDVRFVLSPGTDESPPQDARFKTENGRFDWMPATAAAPASAVFTGPTALDLTEGGTVTTRLNAAESIELVLSEVDGKQGISSLVARGAVSFQDQNAGLAGSGREMTLEPREGRQGRMRLFGSPAKAEIRDPDGKTQVVEANRIAVDPEDGSLEAEDSVVVRLSGLGLAGGDRAATAPARPDAPPARLMCQFLDVRRDETGRNVVKARRGVSIEDEANSVSARSEELDYVENDGRIFLRGAPGVPASLTRLLGADAGGSPNFVTITGPDLRIDSATSNLTCEREGRIELVQPIAEGARSTKVRARSAGPIRYGEGVLDLSTDVIIYFDEDDVEVRSLFCDRAKVFFSQAENPESAPAAGASDAKARMGGFEELLAEGRVHLIQTQPRDMEAEGHQLRWRVVDGKETLYLRGSSPRCWIRGLSENSHLRYEADSFVVLMGSQDFTAENGRLIYEPETLPK